MTVSIGDLAQLISAIAMLTASVYALRAWHRLNEAAERYTRALVAMQEAAAAGTLPQLRPVPPPPQAS